MGHETMNDCNSLADGERNSISIYMITYISIHAVAPARRRVPLVSCSVTLLGMRVLAGYGDWEMRASVLVGVVPHL